MGGDCCESEKKVTYSCAAGKDCPPKEVKESDPAPECCGAPMKKKEGCCG